MRMDDNCTCKHDSDDQSILVAMGTGGIYALPAGPPEGQKETPKAPQLHPTDRIRSKF
jgi:hypothetical protein